MRRIGFTLAFLSLLSAPLWAGIHFKSRTYQEGQGAVDQAAMTVEAWIDGENGKVEFSESGNPMMQAGSYLLTTDGGKIVYLVDPKNETYVEWDLQAMTDLAGSVMDGMGSMFSMEISDPKVEKLLEEPGGMVAGFPTTHYRFRTTYEMVMKVMGMKRAQATDSIQDLWVTDEFADAAMGIWLRKEPPKFGNPELDKLVEAEMTKVTGWPLKVIDERTTTDQKGRATTTRTITQVEELSRQAIDGGIYVIPANYMQTQMMPGMPPGMTAPEEEEQEQEEERGRFRKLLKGTG